MKDMKSTKDPMPASPQQVYGAIVYWLSIGAALICAIAPVVTLAFPDRNVVDPHSLFSAIWAGERPEAIWAAASGGPPGSHFWLRSLGSGDAMIQAGFELGCCSAGVALLATTLSYLGRGHRSWGWAAASLAIAVFVALAALGIYQQTA